MICKRHTHSSLKSSTKCAAKRVDLILQGALLETRKTKRIILNYCPPRVAMRGAIKVFIFTEDRRTAY